jgi:hypothetical protein
MCCGGKWISAVAQSSLNALAAFPDGRVRQADGHEVELLAAAEVDLEEIG